MFGIFKKKTEVDKLDAQYRRLMKDAHRLSTSDRKASDLKVAEANPAGEAFEQKYQLQTTQENDQEIVLHFTQ